MEGDLIATTINIAMVISAVCIAAYAFAKLMRVGNGVKLKIKILTFFSFEVYGLVVIAAATTLDGIVVPVLIMYGLFIVISFYRIRVKCHMRDAKK